MGVSCSGADGRVSCARPHASEHVRDCYSCDMLVAACRNDLQLLGVVAAQCSTSTILYACLPVVHGHHNQQLAVLVSGESAILMILIKIHSAFFSLILCSTCSV